MAVTRDLDLLTTVKGPLLLNSTENDTIFYKSLIPTSTGTQELVSCGWKCEHARQKGRS